MTKPKIKFNVYSVDHLDYGDGRKDQARYFQGTTYAVSEKQAIAQVKYRLGIRPSDLSCYYAGDGGRTTTFEAIKA